MIIEADKESSPSLEYQKEPEDEGLLDHILESISVLARPKRKTIKIETKTCKNSLKSVRLSLVTQLDVYSQHRLRVCDYSRCLGVFRYRGEPVSILGGIGDSLEKRGHQSALTLINLFQEFQKDHLHTSKFYVMYRDTVVLICSHQQEHCALIYTHSLDLPQRLEAENISSHTMMVEGEDNVYSSLVRKGNVRVFWNYLTNDLLRGLIGFEITANFRYLCSFESIPIEVYNSKGYSEDRQRDYHLRLEGWFLKENLEKLHDVIHPSSELCIEWKSYMKTHQFESILVMGFNQQNQEEADHNVDRE